MRMRMHPSAEEPPPTPSYCSGRGDGVNALFLSTFSEDLASYGYFVVGLTEPYNASFEDLTRLKQ